MKKTLALLFFFFSITVTNAETYLAKQDVNVRSGPGSKYDLLGVINSGDKLEVLEISGAWAKISFKSNEEGYVSLNFIQQETQATSTNSNSVSNNSLGFFDYLKYGLLFVIGLIIYRFVEKYFGIYYECSKCNEHRRFFNEPKLFRGKCPDGGLHRWYID
jgi:uncharacterized protein YgiM (DUF1202 family)